jgi:hypothetical protein
MLRWVAPALRILLLVAGTAIFTFATFNWVMISFVQGPAAGDRTDRIARMFNGFLILTPFWLFALWCLAWPVASLLLARRRRRGRGFEVEGLGRSVPLTPQPPRVDAAEPYR